MNDLGALVRVELNAPIFLKWRIIMKVISKLSGEEYDTREIVRIFNSRQYAKYVANGAEFIDYGEKEDKFYLVFRRDDVRELFDKWCKFEL